MDGIKIAAVVILYHPGKSLSDNVNLMAEQVDKLFLVNNSETELMKGIYDDSFSEKIECINLYKNLGVAAALNLAADNAIKQGFIYLLTLDQDSSVKPDLIKNFIHYIKTNNFIRIGILAPNYIYKDYLEKGKKNFDHPVQLTMTSGSLLNLDAYKKVGPFLEKLFIDYVDFEYCLRLRKKGFTIIKVHNANIYHNLGSIQERNFLFRKISITDHSPLRLFYRTRNRFYVYKSYLKDFPVFVLKDLIVFLNELIKILVYEKNKIEKYKWILKGFIYFLKNKMGKYELE
jgi:rhamnosyltransferase